MLILAPFVPHTSWKWWGAENWVLKARAEHQDARFALEVLTSKRVGPVISARCTRACLLRTCSAVQCENSNTYYRAASRYKSGACKDRHCGEVDINSRNSVNCMLINRLMDFIKVSRPSRIYMWDLQMTMWKLICVVVDIIMMKSNEVEMPCSSLQLCGRPLTWKLLKMRGQAWGAAAPVSQHRPGNGNWKAVSRSGACAFLVAIAYCPNCHLLV